MKYALALGCITTIVLYASSASAKSSLEIERISRGFTVKIESENKLNAYLSEGSGFIVHGKGDVYTVVTNRHVICPQENERCITPPASTAYLVVTPDGEKYSVSPSAVKMLGQDLDLAIVQFRSIKKYPVAQINTSSTLKADDIVHVAGFPAYQSKLRFSVGQSLVVVRKRLNGDNGGYTIGYNAFTLPGMSGGAVFDRDGRVVAIHGQGDRFPILGNLPSIDAGEEGSKADTNRGIPVEYLVRELKAIQIDIGGKNLPSISVPENSVTMAEEYLLKGYNRWISSNSKIDKLVAIAEKRQAIEFYNKSIKLNPRQAKPYALRGFTYFQIKEFDKVISDYNLAVNNDPKYTTAYFLRGNFKLANLKDFRGAIDDYNKAILLEPEYSPAYINRSDAKLRLNDLQGAISDSSRAIEIEPNKPDYYLSRIIQKLKINDINSAKSDIERMLENAASNLDILKSYYYSALLKRKFFSDRVGSLRDLQTAKNLLGNLKIKNGSLIAAINVQIKELELGTITVNDSIMISAIKKQEAGDIQGALSDYNRVIELDPKNAQAYLSRALIKFLESKDIQGAKLDLDQVIKLDPRNMFAHLNRGMLKRILQDRAGAVEDIRKAVQFYKETDLGEESKIVKATINSQLQELGINDLKL
jgi:tetratricopeptide (TPR) repeat protein